MEKTNALRLLDINNIKYSIKEYDSNITDGETIAKILDEDPDNVFKTLVTISNKNEYLVFCIPVNKTLNLKKAAKASESKSIIMIKQKELYPLTGYIHGGCSPIGMKKTFRTFFDETIILFDKIYISAGRVGLQMVINRLDLINYTNGTIIDLVD